MTFLNPPHFDDPFALLAELHTQIANTERVRAEASTALGLCTRCGKHGQHINTCAYCGELG